MKSHTHHQYFCFISKYLFITFTESCSGVVSKLKMPCCRSCCAANCWSCIIVSATTCS